MLMAADHPIQPAAAASGSAPRLWNPGVKCKTPITLPRISAGVDNCRIVVASGHTVPRLRTPSSRNSDHETQNQFDHANSVRPAQNNTRHTSSQRYSQARCMNVMLRFPNSEPTPDASNSRPAPDASVPRWSLAKAGITARWLIPNPPHAQASTRTVSSTGARQIWTIPSVKFRRIGWDAGLDSRGAGRILEIHTTLIA